jgi:hypothetical protein
MHAMKAYEGLWKYNYVFLTSTQDGGVNVSLTPSFFTTGEISLYPSQRRLSGHQSQPGRFGKEKHLLPCRESNHDSLVVEPTA